MAFLFHQFYYIFSYIFETECMEHIVCGSQIILYYSGSVKFPVYERT